MKKNKLNPQNMFHKTEEKKLSPSKRAASGRKIIVRVIAIFCSLLMISGIIGSIIYYLN